jgi:hypothetical protein
MKRKTNLFDWLKGLNKPKSNPQPQMKEISMSDKQALFATIKNLMDAYVSARIEIDKLKSANRSFAARVKDLEDAASADAAQDAEMATTLATFLADDAGGSTGGVVG